MFMGDADYKFRAECLSSIDLTALLKYNHVLKSPFKSTAILNNFNYAKFI